MKEKKIEFGTINLDIPESHQQSIKRAACDLIGVADDLGIDLVKIIAEMERFIIEETKVSDATKCPIPAGRNGYTLLDGRIVKVKREA